jgi:hypothetical protein
MHLQWLSCRCKCHQEVSWLQTLTDQLPLLLLLREVYHHIAADAKPCPAGLAQTGLYCQGWAA